MKILIVREYSFNITTEHDMVSDVKEKLCHI